MKQVGIPGYGASSPSWRWVREPVEELNQVEDRLRERIAPLSPRMDQLMQPEIDRIMGGRRGQQLEKRMIIFHV